MIGEFEHEQLRQVLVQMIITLFRPPGQGPCDFEESLSELFSVGGACCFSPSLLKSSPLKSLSLMFSYGKLR